MTPVPPVPLRSPASFLASAPRAAAGNGATAGNGASRHTVDPALPWNGRYYDFIAGGGAREPTPETVAQRLMESRLFVRLYENVMRPFFVRVFAGPNAGAPTPAEEARMYVELLAIERGQGPWLDMSCGAGGFTRGLAEARRDATVVGLDISGQMLDKAAAQLAELSNICLIRADVHELPFPDAVFAGVNNAGSLHLYKDRDTVFAEVFRVLRPGGTYVVSTFAESDRLLGRVFTKLTGVRRTDLPALPGHLARFGFTDYDERRYGDIFMARVRKPA